jgi:thioredoxin-related protein
MAKPIVDGIERDLEGRAQVVRLSVMSEIGSRAAQRYAVRSVPTLVIFDCDGKRVDQTAGVPSRKKVVAQVEGLCQ